MNLKKISFIFQLLTFSVALQAQDETLQISFNKPAQQWEETFPLGNGRIGMTPDGGIENELIVLNDISLWSGAPQDANNYEAYKHLPEIRRLINEGRNDEAQALIDKDFICLGKGSESVPFGCFQLLGNLRLTHHYADRMDDHQVHNYRRVLNLNEAIATTDFSRGGIHYKREYFTSFDHDIGLVRITASKAKSISLTLAIDRPERGESRLNGEDLELFGTLASGTTNESS